MFLYILVALLFLKYWLVTLVIHFIISNVTLVYLIEKFVQILSATSRLVLDTLIIWLWKENMPKQRVCVPNCCEDLLLPGKGNISILYFLFLKITGKSVILFFEIWEYTVLHRWVFHFAHLRQLPVLVPYIPTENPRLRDTAYEVCEEIYSCQLLNFCLQSYWLLTGKSCYLVFGVQGCSCSYRYKPIFS